MKYIVEHDGVEVQEFDNEDSVNDFLDKSAIDWINSKTGNRVVYVLYPEETMELIGKGTKQVLRVVREEPN